MAASLGRAWQGAMRKRYRSNNKNNWYNGKSNGTGRYRTVANCEYFSCYKSWWIQRVLATTKHLKCWPCHVSFVLDEKLSPNGLISICVYTGRCDPYHGHDVVGRMTIAAGTHPDVFPAVFFHQQLESQWRLVYLEKNGCLPCFANASSGLWQWIHFPTSRKIHLYIYIYMYI